MNITISVEGNYSRQSAPKIFMFCARCPCSTVEHTQCSVFHRRYALACLCVFMCDYVSVVQNIGYYFLAEGAFQAGGKGGGGGSRAESQRFRRADVPHSSNSQSQGHRRDSHTVDEGWLSSGCNPTLHCAPHSTIHSTIPSFRVSVCMCVCVYVFGFLRQKEKKKPLHLFNLAILYIWKRNDNLSKLTLAS